VTAVRAIGKGADMGLRQENHTQYRGSNDLH
jgi:hypothetical protein